MISGRDRLLIFFHKTVVCVRHRVILGLGAWPKFVLSAKRRRLRFLAVVKLTALQQFAERHSQCFGEQHLFKIVAVQEEERTRKLKDANTAQLDCLRVQLGVHVDLGERYLAKEGTAWPV